MSGGCVRLLQNNCLLILGTPTNAFNRKHDFVNAKTIGRRPFIGRFAPKRRKYYRVPCPEYRIFRTEYIARSPETIITRQPLVISDGFVVFAVFEKSRFVGLRVYLRTNSA